MALLLRDREAANGAAPPPSGNGASAVVPDFACEACGAGMVRGQDWCLECGTAARGRLGQKAGWRAAFTIVALTLLLVSGAGIAGYAALTTDSERTAAAPSQGNGAPITAQAPSGPDTGVPATGVPGTGVPGVPGPTATTITPGNTGPGVTPPPASATSPIVPQVIPGGSTPVQPGSLPGLQTPAGKGPKIVIPPTKATVPPTNQAVTPPAATTPPKGTTSTPTTVTPAVVGPQIIKLKADAAKTYDPATRAGAEIGPAKNAIDGKKNTVWDVTVPADGNPIGVGVLVDLGAPYALQSLRIATNTPGYTVEIYGAVDAKEIPVDLIDKRWQHLTTRKDVEDNAPIPLKGKGEAPKYQLVLVHVTTPGEPTDPRAAIGELTFRGTP